MTSPTSNRRYQVSFFSGEPLLISEAMYQKWCEEDDNHVMLIDRAKTIKLKDRLIRTADISGIDEYRNYEEENKWIEPKPEELNHKNLAHLREMKRRILDNKEKYDPRIHLPKEWREKLAAHGSDLGRKDVSLNDQQAIQEGRAVVDARGYVVYDYDRQLAFDTQRKQTIIQDKIWEDRIKEAPDE